MYPRFARPVAHRRNPCLSRKAKTPAPEGFECPAYLIPSNSPSTEIDRCWYVVLWEKPPPKVESTYNSQKTEGTPLKLVHKPKGKTQYGNQKGCPTRISDGSRHPTSIIEHENIYVFDNTITDDIELSRNKDLREYAEKVFKFIGKTKKQIIKKIGQKIDHYFRFKSSQFGLCTIETYNELIKEYKIDEMEEYLEYEINVSIPIKSP